MEALLSMKVFKFLLVFLVSIAFYFVEPVTSNGALNQGSSLLLGLANEKPLSESEIGNSNKLSETRADGEEVTQLDRFYRVYEDGTIEFKFVLSNGVAQYQKITNKEVNGKTIQVYEGYNSELLPDKTYRTTYYIADENRYRRIRREFDTKPPKLPAYVPYVPKLKQG